MSHQLTELERRLGFSLFTRDKRRLALTPAGAQLVEASRRLLSDLAKTEASLREQAGRSRSTVRISTECYTCYHWLPAVLSRFRNEHPDVDVRIALDLTRQPVPALLAGDLDVAISSRAPSARLEGVTLFRDELVCAIGRSHLLAKKPFLSAEDFASVDLFTYDVPKEDLSWLQNKVLGGVIPRSVTRVPLTEAILELVRAGLGISVLARWAVEPYLRTQALVARPLTRRGLHRTWRALYRKNASAHVKAFAKAVGRAALEPQTA